MEVEVFVQWEKRFWTPCLSPPRPPLPLRPPPTANSPTNQLVHGTRQVFHTAILTKSYGNVILILSSLSSGTSSISGSSCSSARSPCISPGSSSGYLSSSGSDDTSMSDWFIHWEQPGWGLLLFEKLEPAGSWWDLYSSAPHHHYCHGHLFSAILILMYVETDHDWVLALGLDGSLRDPGLDGSLCDLGLDGSLRDPGLDGSLRNPDLLLIHVDVLLNDQT